MPTRDYDPRRYGPTIDVGAVAASGGLQSASVASRRPLLRGTAGVLVGRGRASSRGDVPTHEVPSSSDDAATPRKGRCGIYLNVVAHFLSLSPASAASAVTLMWAFVAPLRGQWCSYVVSGSCGTRTLGWRQKRAADTRADHWALEQSVFLYSTTLLLIRTLNHLYYVLCSNEAGSAGV